MNLSACDLTLSMYGKERKWCTKTLLLPLSLWTTTCTVRENIPTTITSFILTTRLNKTRTWKLRSNSRWDPSKLKDNNASTVAEEIRENLKKSLVLTQQSSLTWTLINQWLSLIKNLTLTCLIWNSKMPLFSMEAFAVNKCLKDLPLKILS